MWRSSVSPVSPSMAPRAIDVQFRCMGSQKSQQPHREQKPRLMCSEDRYQLRCSEPSSRTADFLTLAEAKQCPDCLRHWRQWQAIGEVNGSVTSKRMDPQLHEPLSETGEVASM